MESNLTLRQFCVKKGLDPAFISRIENGIIPAPSKESLLKTLAKSINLNENTPDWVEFFDLAYVSRGEVPRDIEQDFPQLLAYLPAFLRSVKKSKVTKKDVKELLELIRSGYEEPYKE